MPTIRNPGPWSFAIFACAALLVAFLYWRGAPDAVQLAGSLIAVVVSTFGAKSALASRSSSSSSTGNTGEHARPPMHTWPEFKTPTPGKAVDAEWTPDEEAPPTPRVAGGDS